MSHQTPCILGSADESIGLFACQGFFLYSADMPLSPLANKRILLTRASHQMDETAALLSQYHAVAVPFPCLELEVLSANIQQGLQQTDKFSDVLFTSSNGIEAVASSISPPLKQFFMNQRIAVVGEKTARALECYHLNAALIPSQASQQGLIEAYQHKGLPRSLLFFRAEFGSDLVIDFLRKNHVQVALIKAYRSICPQDDATQVRQMLSTHGIDAVLLGSPKVAEYYLKRVGELHLANQAVLVAISQNVANAADKLGLKVQLIAKQTSFPSMLDSLVDYFSQRSQ